MKKRIVIGNDHAGTTLKFLLIQFLEEYGYALTNMGTDSDQSVDYPDYVHPVAQCIQNNEAEFGILICGSAQGVSIAANKYKNIRAAVCWKSEVAELARRHNDANILCLPARYISELEANTTALVFLQTGFDGGRHLKRVQKIGLKLS